MPKTHFYGVIYLFSSRYSYLQWSCPSRLLLIKEAGTDRGYLLCGWDRGDIL